MPSADEFEVWLEHPITAWVLAGVGRYAALQRESWTAAAWASGVADQDSLTRCTVRADAYAGLAAIDYTMACGLHEQEAVDGEG